MCTHSCMCVCVYTNACVRARVICACVCACVCASTMLPFDHREPSSSSRTRQHSRPLHRKKLPVCVHGVPEGVRGQKPRARGTFQPARTPAPGWPARKRKDGATRGHTGARASVQAPSDLPVGEKPGMMLTVSVACTTCHTQGVACVHAHALGRARQARPRGVRHTSLSRSATSLPPSAAPVSAVQTAHDRASAACDSRARTRGPPASGAAAARSRARQCRSTGNRREGRQGVAADARHQGWVRGSPEP